MAVVNLGCPKNVVDGERMAGLLVRAGFRATNDPRRAEAVIVNTCGFIEDAKRESIEAILQAGELKRKACRVLVVGGCLAQRYCSDLSGEMPEVDAFIGVSEIGRIAEVVRDALEGNGSRERRYVAKPEASLAFLPRRLSTPVHTAYLKIGDGCDNRCAYCTIPQIRGRMRSAPMEDLIAESKDLAKQGAKELTLVSQDSARYGEDLYGRNRITELLQGLSEISGITWLRLLYLHPAHVAETLLETVADSPKVCKYVDLPIQHISDRILSAMNRKVTGKEIRTLIKNIRTRISGAALRTTLIVGLPGETEKEFEELLEFVEETRFDRLGVFRYSREAGTKAARMLGQVEDDVKSERLERLMETQRQISQSLLKKKIGRKLKVIVDSVSPKGNAIGRSEAEALDIDGVIHLQGAAKRGDFVSARIQSSDDHDLYGETVRPEG